ncbi:MAG: RsmB/NOP family class I SAM-dependent RNA methyltransferase, partial [Patescibacteria group bacterium]
QYYQNLLGSEESEAFFAALEAKKTRRSIRVNTLKLSKSELKKWLKSQGYTVTDNPFSPDGIDLEGKGKLLALKLPYHAGFTYPQDSSSMFGVELLDPKPNEWVIDLTAAPGGKSSHIAAKMKNSGVLVSNDWDRNRIKALRYNFERLGVQNGIIMSMLPHKLSALFSETFDRVLLDPSCSGEGLWVTPKAKPDFWNPKALKRYASEQFGLLKSAFTLLKPGGRLVYSTCTLNPIENDGVVDRLMKEFPQAELVALPEHLKENIPEQIKPFKGVRFWPHKSGTKGFFCIALTKKESIFPGDILQKESFEPDFSSHPLFPDKLFIKLGDLYYLVPKDFKEFPFPETFFLSLPFIKKDNSGDRLTHAAALFPGIQSEKIYVLDREQVEALFSQKIVPRK